MKHFIPHPAKKNGGQVIAQIGTEKKERNTLKLTIKLKSDFLKLAQ